MTHLLCGTSLYAAVGRPHISDIQCDPEVPECNRPATLSCTIKDYYPKDLTNQWYRGLELISTDNDPEGAKEDPESGLFTRTTQIQIIPTISDHGTEFYMEIMYRTMTTKRTFSMQLKGIYIICICL